MTNNLNVNGEKNMMKHSENEKGSLALEQVLFIGAVVLMSLGLFAFYDKLGNYFQNFDISGLRTSVPSSGSGGTTTTPNP